MIASVSEHFVGVVYPDHKRNNELSIVFYSVGMLHFLIFFRDIV